MKILWVSHFVPYPPKAGMLSRSYNLLREVSKYHEVYLLALVQEKPLLTMFESIDAGKVEAKTELSQFCKHVEFISKRRSNSFLGKYLTAFRSLFSTLPYSANWFRSNRMQNAIQNVLENNDINVIHIDTIGLAPFVKELGKYPMLLTHHNVESHMMLRRAAGPTNWIEKIYYYIDGKKLERYERKVCPNFAVNITCSSLDSGRLLDVSKNLNVEEVPNGVDTNYFKPESLDIEPHSLIFVGGLNWYPNLAAIEFFVHEVWPILKANCKDVVLDIVGSHPPPDFYKLAELDESLRIHGFVDEIRPLISKAAVYICPISDGGGTKLKVLDALSMKKALVANPISCEGINVVDGESVLFAVKPEEYVERILKIFEDESLRVKLGENGRKLMEDSYSYSLIGKRLSAMYDLVGKGNR